MTSKCAACNSTRFELKEVSPTGSNFRYYFIQCGGCGDPKGITQMINTNILIENKVKELENRISSLNTNLDIVNRNLQNLMNYITSKLR